LLKAHAPGLPIVSKAAAKNIPLMTVSPLDRPVEVALDLT
jgi:hypothetical protein